MRASKDTQELNVAEEILSVLPSGSVMRVCSDDRETLRYAVRAAGLKLRLVTLSRASLRLEESRHVLDGTDETTRTTLVPVRHSRKGAQDVERAVGPDRAIHRDGQAPIPSGQFNLPLNAVAVESQM